MDSTGGSSDSVRPGSAKAHLIAAGDHLRAAGTAAVVETKAWAWASLVQAVPFAAKYAPAQSIDATAAEGDASEEAAVTVVNQDGETITVPKGIILPTAPWKEKWDIWIMLLILYSAATAPVRVCFGADPVGIVWLFEATMSLVFLTDMYFTFNTAFLLDGSWVTSRGEIAANYFGLKSYMLGWFWIDGPSSLPLELIELLMPPGSDTGSLKGLRVLRMFRLIRLLRLLKVDQYISRLEEAFDINLRPMRLVKLVVMMLFMAHMLGCGWFYLALNPPDGEPNWAGEYDDGSVLREGTPVSRQYMLAIYWSFMTLTTVGYGDVVPVNDTERAFVTFALVVGALVFAFIVGEIGGLVSQLDQQASLVEEKMDQVKEYLTWRSLPRDLVVRVRRYYEHYYTRKAVFDEKDILEGLNPQLQSEAMSHILKELLGKLSFFDQLTKDFQRALFPLLVPMPFEKGHEIYIKGGQSTELLFLISGDLECSKHGIPTRRLTPMKMHILDQDNPTDVTVAMDFAGCFGQSVLLGRRRDENVRALTQVEVMSISKDNLQKLFEADPISARRFCKIVLDDYKRNDRLYTLGMKMRIAGISPRDEVLEPRIERPPPAGAGGGGADPYKTSDLRAALKLQVLWKRFCDEITAANDPLYQIIEKQELSLAERFRSRSFGTHMELGAVNSSAASASSSDHSNEDAKWRGEMKALLLDLRARIENIEAQGSSPQSSERSSRSRGIKMGLPGRSATQGSLPLEPKSPSRSSDTTTQEL
jgi:hypothetical protein